MNVLINRRRVVGNKPNYSSMYLTFEALEPGTFTLTIPSGVTTLVTSVSYSLDDGVTWITTNNTSESVNITTPAVSTGLKVLWKGIASAMASDNNTYCNFSSTCRFNVIGNLRSLLNGDSFINLVNSGMYLFRRLFYNNQNVISAENLILPFTSVGTFAYSGMFANCSSMIKGPQILATALGYNACSYMFENCTSLVGAPLLYTTTLGDNACYAMFKGCMLLVNVPVLPAQTLGKSCYREMFQDCTSLTDAPVLPASIIPDNSYRSMFYGCIALVNAPALPAETLGSTCYQYMFANCTSLTTAPELPAETLADGCYNNMFQGCSNLNYIKALFTTEPGSNYTANWVKDVSSTGTFVKSDNATWNITGNNGIPSGWTIETQITNTSN